eukprot:2475801-Prymnesium_polylepis.1
MRVGSSRAPTWAATARSPTRGVSRHRRRTEATASRARRGGGSRLTGASRTARTPLPPPSRRAVGRGCAARPHPSQRRCRRRRQTGGAPGVLR